MRSPRDAQTLQHPPRSPTPAEIRSLLTPSPLELPHLLPAEKAPWGQHTEPLHGSSRRAGSAPGAHSLSLSSLKPFPLFSPLCACFDHTI